MATGNFFRRGSIQRLMNTVLVVVVHERVEFSLKVLSIPIEGVVKKLTTNGSDQSFNEGM